MLSGFLSKKPGRPPQSKLFQHFRVFPRLQAAALTFLVLKIKISTMGAHKTPETVSWLLLRKQAFNRKSFSFHKLCTLKMYSKDKVSVNINLFIFSGTEFI